MSEDIRAKFVRINAARKAATNLRQLSSACKAAFLREEGAVFVQEAIDVIKTVEDKALDYQSRLLDETIGKAALKAEDILKVLAFRIAAADRQAKPNLLDPAGRQVSSPHKEMFKESRDSLRQVLPMLTDAADADFTDSDSEDAAQQQQLQEQLSQDSGNSGGLEASLSSFNSESIKPHQVICNSELVLREVIGSGAEGKVYRGTWTNIDIAAKEYAGVDDDDADSGAADTKTSSEAAMQRARNALCKDVALLMCFNHPNLVRFCGVCLDPPLVVMEFYKHGNVFQMIEKARRQWVNNQARSGAPTTKQATKYMDYFTWDRRLEMLHDVSNGMMYLHQRHYIHGDLRSANLFVGLDGRVKIGDFGFTKRSNSQQRSMQVKRITHPRWVAPELMTDYRLSSESDVYSFGTIMYEMLTWQLPFYNLTQEQAWGGFKKLMQECWDQDTAKRPPFERIAARLKAMIRWRMVIQRNTLLTRVAAKLKAAGQAHRAVQVPPPVKVAVAGAPVVMNPADLGAVGTSNAAQEDLEMPGTPPLPRPEHPIVQVADFVAEADIDPSLVMLPVVLKTRLPEVPDLMTGAVHSPISSESTTSASGSCQNRASCFSPFAAHQPFAAQTAVPPRQPARALVRRQSSARRSDVSMIGPNGERLLVGSDVPEDPCGQCTLSSKASNDAAGLSTTTEGGATLQLSTPSISMLMAMPESKGSGMYELQASNSSEATKSAPSSPVRSLQSAALSASATVEAEQPGSPRPSGYPLVDSTETVRQTQLVSAKARVAFDDEPFAVSPMEVGDKAPAAHAPPAAPVAIPAGSIITASSSVLAPASASTKLDTIQESSKVASSTVSSGALGSRGIAEVDAGTFSLQTASQQHAQQEQERQSLDHFAAQDSPFFQNFGFHSVFKTTSSSNYTIPSLQEGVGETKTASVGPPASSNPAASEVCNVSFTAAEASPFANLDLFDDPCESVGLPGALKPVYDSGAPVDRDASPLTTAAAPADAASPQVVAAAGPAASSQEAAVVSQQDTFYQGRVHNASFSPGPFMQAAAFPGASMGLTAYPLAAPAFAQSAGMVVGSPQQQQQLLAHLTQQQRTAPFQVEGMQAWQQTALMAQQHRLMGLNPAALLPHQLQQLQGGHHVQAGMMPDQCFPGQQPMADSSGPSRAVSSIPSYRMYSTATLDSLQEQGAAPVGASSSTAAGEQPAAADGSTLMHHKPLGDDILNKRLGDSEEDCVIQQAKTLEAWEKVLKLSTALGSTGDVIQQQQWQDSASDLRHVSTSGAAASRPAVVPAAVPISAPVMTYPASDAFLAPVMGHGFMLPGLDPSVAAVMGHPMTAAAGTRGMSAGSMARAGSGFSCVHPGERIRVINRRAAHQTGPGHATYLAQQSPAAVSTAATTDKVQGWPAARRPDAPHMSHRQQQLRPVSPRTAPAQQQHDDAMTAALHQQQQLKQTEQAGFGGTPAGLVVSQGYAAAGMAADPAMLSGWSDAIAGSVEAAALPDLGDAFAAQQQQQMQMQQQMYHMYMQNILQQQRQQQQFSPPQQHPTAPRQQLQRLPQHQLLSQMLRGAAGGMPGYAADTLDRRFHIGSEKLPVASQVLQTSAPAAEAAPAAASALTSSPPVSEMAARVTDDEDDEPLPRPEHPIWQVPDPVAGADEDSSAVELPVARTSSAPAAAVAQFEGEAAPEAEAAAEQQQVDSDSPLAAHASCNDAAGPSTTSWADHHRWATTGLSTLTTVQGSGMYELQASKSSEAARVSPASPVRSPQLAAPSAIATVEAEQPASPRPPGYPLVDSTETAAQAHLVCAKARGPVMLQDTVKQQHQQMQQAEELEPANAEVAAESAAVQPLDTTATAVTQSQTSAPATGVCTQDGQLEEHMSASVVPTTAATATTQPGSCSTDTHEPVQPLAAAAAAAAEESAFPCSVAPQKSPLKLEQLVHLIAQQHADTQDSRSASSATPVEAQRSSSSAQAPDDVEPVQPGPVADAAAELMLAPPAALRLQSGMEIEAVTTSTIPSLAEEEATAAGVFEPTSVGPPAVQDDMSCMQAALSSLQQLQPQPSSRLLRLMLLYTRYQAAITMSQVQQQLRLLPPPDSTAEWQEQQQQQQQQQHQHQQQVLLQLQALLLLLRSTQHQQLSVRIPLIQLVSQFAIVHLSIGTWRQWAVDTAAARRPTRHFDSSSSSSRSGAKPLLALCAAMAIMILCWLLPPVTAAVVLSTAIAWKWLSTQFPGDLPTHRQCRQQLQLQRQRTPAVPGTSSRAATQAISLPVHSSLSGIPGTLLVGPQTDACSSAVGYASWPAQWQAANATDAPLAAQQQHLLLHTLPMHRYSASYKQRTARQQGTAAAPAGHGWDDDVRIRDQGQLASVPPAGTGDGATEIRQQMLDISRHPILGSQALSPQQPAASFLQSLDHLMQQQQQQQQDVPGQGSTAIFLTAGPRYAQVLWICLDAPMMLEALPTGSSLATWLVNQQHVQQHSGTRSSDSSQLDTWCQPFAAALWHQVLTWLQQVVAALAALHSVGIVHGGLHAGTVYLADAGGSCSSRSHMASVADSSSGGDSSSTALLSLAAPWQHAVTPGCVVDAAFAPPEVQLGSQHPTSSPAVDVYGFGMVMWQLATGWVPQQQQQSDITGSQPTGSSLAVYDELSWCAEMLQRHKTTFPGAVAAECTQYHGAHHADRVAGPAGHSVAKSASQAPQHAAEGTDASHASSSSKAGTMIDGRPCSWDCRHGWLPLLADAWLPAGYKQLMFDCCSVVPEQRPSLSAVSQRVAAMIGEHTYRS